MEYNFEHTEKIVERIKVEPFNDSIVKVYKYKDVYVDGVLSTSKKHVFFTDAENVEHITKENHEIKEKITVDDFYEHYAHVKMISKENMDAILNGTKFPYDDHIMEDYDDDIYTEDTYELVLWNWGSHQLKYIDKTWVILPVIVGYMYEHGRMTEQKYDLEAVVERLSGKDIITENNEPLRISKIPYYNAQEDERLQLEFIFKPTPDSFIASRPMDRFKMVEYMLKETFGITPKSNYEY